MNMETKKIVGAALVLLQMAVPSHAQKVLNVYQGGVIVNSMNTADIDSIVIRDGAQPDNVETFDVNGVTFNMVKVEGGTFLMGATYEQGSDYYNNERPVHEVTLSDYYIGETEVTQALWKAVMGSNPSNFKGNDLLPVENVSWDKCQEFIEKLNTLTGRQFRLPTEAQWEYAARGGNRAEDHKYSGSDNLDEVGWYTKNSDGRTHKVATKAPNELGLYDMSGNVYEWCQDWYGQYGGYAQKNPTGPSSGSYRVNRGGSWNDGAGNCRVSYRYFDTPSISDCNQGLRLAL